jgi:hypothetical protein
MTKALAALLVALPLLVRAQVSPPQTAPPAPAQAQQPAQPPVNTSPAPAEQPSSPPPESMPPAPPVAPPIEAPAQMSAPPAPTSWQAERVNVPPVNGQWVYTAQYGWIWIPFGPQFVHVPTGGAPPQMFVFYPAAGGWTWVVAPWVWGLGPQPYWGVHGVNAFPWWGRGVGRWYGFAPAYVGWGGRYFWNGHRWVPTTRRYPSVRVVARSPQRFPPRGPPGHPRRWR